MTELIFEYDIRRWNRLRIKLKSQFNRRPDLQGILFLIGHRELGQMRSEFTKEEKQDVLHIAVCTLLSKVGFYTFVGRDEEGWPHFEVTRTYQNMTGEEQEKLLKRLVLDYFEAL